MSRCLMGGTDNAKPHRHVVIRRLADLSATIHSFSSCPLYWNFVSRVGDWLGTERCAEEFGRFGSEEWVLIGIFIHVS